MTLIKLAAVAAVVLCTLAEAHEAQSTGKKSQQRSSQPLPQPASQTLYASAFTDYRPFSGDAAPKDWRKANDEVRDAGGHIGLMKGQPAPLRGHGAHGSEQPAGVDRK
jgi:hypothetical protein